MADGGLKILEELEEARRKGPELPATVFLFDATDRRDRRDPGELGSALLAFRRRAPKAPLAVLYDRHEATLADAGR